MSMRLIDSLVTTPVLAELFSDESVLKAMLDFESALARAEARRNHFWNGDGFGMG